MLISSNYRSYKVCYQKVVSLVLLHLKGSSLALLVARVAAVMCWVMMLSSGELPAWQTPAPAGGELSHREGIGMESPVSL